MSNDMQNAFIQTLEAVRSQARQQGSCISQEQIKEAFQGQDLTEEQFQLIYEYLRKNKIGIGQPMNPDEYLTGEEIDYLESYLQELQCLPEYTKGEEEAITLSAMAQDPDAQARLTEIYLPRIPQIAKLYAGQNVFLEDLIGEGNVALAAGVLLLGCVETAKEAEGILIGGIMNAMEALIEETAEDTRADQKVADLVNQVADAARDLAESLRRPVTVEELAAESGITEEDIREAIRVSGDGIEDIASEKDSDTELTDRNLVRKKGQGMYGK